MNTKLVVPKSFFVFALTFLLITFSIFLTIDHEEEVNLPVALVASFMIGFGIWLLLVPEQLPKLIDWLVYLTDFDQAAPQAKIAEVQGILADPEQLEENMFKKSSRKFNTILGIFLIIAGLSLMSAVIWSIFFR